MEYETLPIMTESQPLIYCITNFVTANDCANMILAAKARPIMSDNKNEAAELIEKSQGLLLNIGTINDNQLDTMLTAGHFANNRKIPIVFDPVGAGATKLRTNAAILLMNSLKISVICGNKSEIMTLYHGKGNTRGVDAISDETSNEQESLVETIEVAKKLSNKTGAIVVVTGKNDIIVGQGRKFLVHNGCELMSNVTGTGCQLTALITVLATVTKPEELLFSVIKAVLIMGVSGEIAKHRMCKADGNMSYRNYIIDAVYNMSDEELEQMANYEEIC